MRDGAMYPGRELERLFALGTANGMTDAELLEQLASGDEGSAARSFEIIVERYGPMVMRICEITLRDVHAADDAFQATFLVLACKARQIQTGELLGNWLYGVAIRTARKAKAIATHRRIRDSHVMEQIRPTIQEPPEDQSDADLDRILHEEISRLPRSYRTAIVVCYLEGLTYAAAAQRLQVAESTIRGRLARARKLLGQRLVRRGISPSTGLTALCNAARVEPLIQIPLVRATARSAVCFVHQGQAVPSVVSATARAIAEGVLFTMRFSRLRMIGVMIIAVGLISTGSAMIAQRNALALDQDEEARANTLSRMKTAHDDPAGRLPEQGERQTLQPQPVAVNPDLVKAVPGPIIRTLPVSKDCMILSYLPDWNFGNVDNIGIGNNDGGVRTLIDWPIIPPDEATSPDRQFLIALYSRKTTSHPPTSVIHVFEIAEEWPERTSWRTKPRYEPEPAVTCKFESGEGWKLFDVTPLVRARARAGRKSHGVVFRFLNEEVSGGTPEIFSDYKLVSREGDGQWANHRPMLLILEAPKPPPPRSN